MKRKILFSVLILGAVLLSACVAPASPPTAEMAGEADGAPTGKSSSGTIRRPWKREEQQFWEDPRGI